MAADLNLSGSDFEEKVMQSPVPVLVDFWAPWCGPCKAIGPSVEAVAVEFADRARVYKVDVDNETDISNRFGIMTIPALLLFNDGKEVERVIGTQTQAQLSAMIQRAL